MKSTRFILAVWCFFCVWVLCVCQSAYVPLEPPGEVAATGVELRCGMPSWVFWGVAVPWVAASAVTIAFALIGIRQEPQDVE